MSQADYIDIQDLKKNNNNKTLNNSFAYANFNYYPLIQHFFSAKSVRKIEKIQERQLNNAQ